MECPRQTWPMIELRGTCQVSIFKLIGVCQLIRIIKTVTFGRLSGIFKTSELVVESGELDTWEENVFCKQKMHF